MAGSVSYWLDRHDIFAIYSGADSRRDRAHSKTVGGLPLVSDTFLLQKQQTFNRSKNLEREFGPISVMTIPSSIVVPSDEMTLIQGLS